MIRTRYLREIFEGRCQEYASDPAAGRRAFLREFIGEVMGGALIEERHSLRPDYRRGEHGLPAKAPASAPASDVSLRSLAEAIMGHEFVQEFYHPSSGFDFRQPLTEAALDPTSFLNVSTFNLAVAGLVNAQILEKFNQPEFIGRSLMQTIPTNMNGQKFIGTGRIPKVDKASKGRQPGEMHAEIGFVDQYKSSPETLEQALKVKVTREAVFFDLTGQVLDEASSVGEELGYGQEKDIADTILGVTGLPSVHSYNGTTYEVYQTSSPWINDIVNPFTDETNYDTARQLYIGMTDPTNGKEIRVEGKTILVMPAKELLHRQQLYASTVQLGTQLNSNFPSRYAFSGQTLQSMQNYTIITLSAIWYNRALAADGLNLSASDAKGLWLIGDFQKAFRWMSNWELTPWQASADELVMKDQGLVSVYGANYRGERFAYEPRYVVRSKNS